MKNKTMVDAEMFIRDLPKTDLHMHLEGSIEPELMLRLADRNGSELRWKTPDELLQAYEFENLQSFLNLYFEGCKVLVTKRDFYDVTRAYLERAQEDGVTHAEMFIGPQSFTERGTPIEALMDGVLDAMAEAWSTDGISSGLLISVHRHRNEEDAFVVLDQIMPWRDRVVGIGMGGAEVGNPPIKFARFFEEARSRGFRTCVHAGEEGPASYVREALEILKVNRIDHGNACLSDPELIEELVHRRISLTVCPLSNLRLKVVRDLADHPLKAMIAAGLHVTINSDDPPYFGGYVTENLLACHREMKLSLAEIVKLVRNGFDAAFICDERRAELVERMDQYVRTHQPAINA